MDSSRLVQIQSSGPAFALSKDRGEGRNAEDNDHQHGEGRAVDPARPSRRAWVNELKATWKRTHPSAQERRCIVNLDEVTFIDKSGERMLRCMSSQGAQLVASDVYVKHVLDRLRGKSN